MRNLVEDIDLVLSVQDVCKRDGYGVAVSLIKSVEKCDTYIAKEIVNICISD
jgi:hypothetical protein